MNRPVPAPDRVFAAPGDAHIFAMSTVDLQSLVSFLTVHCGPDAGNPLTLLSAAQLVRELPVKELALFQEALAGVPLDPSLAALIAERLGEPGARRAA
jgi:hypothetical protein